MSEYLTVQDIAFKLEVTVDTVRRWLRMGKLKGTSFGRAGYRIEKKDFYSFMHRHDDTTRAMQASSSEHEDSLTPSKETFVINDQYFIENALDAIIVRDPMSVIISWNKGAQDLYGWSEQEACNQVTHYFLKTTFPTSREDVDMQLIQHGQWQGLLHHTCKDGRRIIVESRQQLIRNEHGHPVAMLEINRDVTRFKRTEEALQFLAEASRTLSSSLDYETTLQRVFRLIVPIFADICFVDLLTDNQAFQRLVYRNPSLPEDTLSLELIHRFVPDLTQTKHPVVKAFLSEQAELVTTVNEELLRKVTQSDEHYEVAHGLHIHSYMRIPLIAYGKTVGVLTYIYTSDSERIHTPEDLELAQELATRIASAVHNAQQYREQVEARQRAEKLAQELEHQRMRFEQAQNASRIGTFEWDIVADTVYWTPELEALYGISPGTFGGDYASWKRLIHAEDIQRAEEDIKQAFDSHQPYNSEFRSVWSDGSVHWLNGKGEVFYDADGKPIRIIGVNIDITDRKQAEEISQQFAALVENSSEFIGMATLDGQTTYINRAGLELVGLPTTQEAINRPLTDYLPEQLHYYFSSVIMPRIAEQGRWDGDLQFRHFATDETIDVHQTVFLITNPHNNTPLCMATIAHDIREQKELDQRKDTFISMASHELRNPLTAIQANLQLAERRIKNILKQAGETELPPTIERTTQDAQFMLERALRQAKVMNRLIGDLLDGTRIQANKLNLSLAGHDIVAIVHETVQDQREVSHQRTIQLDVSEQEPVIVLVDKDRIAQVISNYLTNALKYSASKEEIVVGLRREEQHVRVWVTDHGPGLTAEQQELVWERYYQVTGISAQSGNGVGLGLGLHICKTLITRQGGQVGVTSAPGSGSTFWFTLPLAETLGYE